MRINDLVSLCGDLVDNLIQIISGRGMSTHSIGPGKVIRSIPLDRAVDMKLGRYCGILDRSKSEVVRRLVEKLLDGSIRYSQLGLLVLVSVGFGLVVAASMQPDTDLIQFGRTAGLVRGARCLRVREGDFVL